MADMRVARTRQYLRAALMDLLREKPYDDVTVREVAQRAQVSKNSFYNHYPDLASLVQDCYMQEIVYFRTPRKRLRDYACRFDACTETLDTRGHMLAFFKTNPNLAKVILDNICISPYFAECRHAEEELLLDHLETEYGESTRSFLTNLDCARYTVWGMFGQMRYWFMNGMREPIETMTTETIYFALHSLAGMACHHIEPEYLEAVEKWHYVES